MMWNGDTWFVFEIREPALQEAQRMKKLHPQDTFMLRTVRLKQEDEEIELEQEETQQENNNK